MVGVDDLDLGAAQTWQTRALAQRQIEVVRRVDDVGRGVHRVLGIDADRAVRPGHPMTISFGTWAKAGRIPNASAAVPAVSNSLRFMVVLLLRGTSAAAPAPLLLATQDSRGRLVDPAL